MLTETRTQLAELRRLKTDLLDGYHKLESIVSSEEFAKLNVYRRGRINGRMQFLKLKIAETNKVMEDLARVQVV